MYLGKLMGSVIHSSSLDLSDYAITTPHFPTPEECMSGQVEYSARAPYQIADDTLSTWTRSVMKTRSHAANSLSNARASVSRGYTANLSRFLRGDFEPEMFDIEETAPSVESSHFTERAGQAPPTTKVVVAKSLPNHVVLLDNAQNYHAGRTGTVSSGASNITGQVAVMQASDTEPSALLAAPDVDAMSAEISSVGQETTAVPQGVQ
jgi:hypothetical protein